MLFFLGFLLVWPVWMRGGARPEWVGPVPWLALAALGSALFWPDRERVENARAARMRALHGFLSDPLLYVGLAFLFLVSLQVWNGPRELEWNSTLGFWFFAPPPRPNLPVFSIRPSEAAEMLLWFGPAWASILAIRHGLSRERKAELLRLLAVNAAWVAAVGLIQQASQAPGIFWMGKAEAPFFATFGYTNHAGAYFVLASVLSGGLLIRELGRDDGGENVVWALPTLLINLMGALFCRSRAAITLAALLSILGSGYALRRLRWRYTTAGWAAVTICLVAVLATAAFVFVRVPGNVVREEWKGTTLAEVRSRVERRGDPYINAAWQIWRDHSWFGVGGWGYRHYVPLFVVPDNPQRVFPEGSANVHNDPLQFLVEFGAVGAGLLVLAVFLLLRPSVRILTSLARRRRDGESRSFLYRIPPLGLALLVGPAVIFFYSFTDLPFRSPAVLWLWFAMLTCAPDFLEHRSSCMEKVAITPSKQVG